MSLSDVRRYCLPEYAISQIRGVLDGHPAVAVVVRYVARAMGNYRTGSDIDLCVDTPSMSLVELLGIANEIDDLLLPWKGDLAVRQRVAYGARRRRAPRTRATVQPDLFRSAYPDDPTF